MAIAEQELKVKISVENDTLAGLAAVRRSIEGTVKGFDERLERSLGRLKDINERFSVASAPLQRIRGLLGEISEESGLARINERVGELGEHFRRAHEAASDFLKPIAALTAMAGLGGLGEAIKSSAERGEALKLASAATGMNVPQLAGFEYAANLANIDDQRAVRALQYLNRNRGEVAAGRAKDVGALLASAGVTSAMSTADAMAKIEDKLHGLQAAGQVQQSSYLAGKLFGERSGVAMLPLLGQGSEHLRELSAEAMRHGQAPSDEWAESAQKFMESSKQMESAVTGLGYAISNELFPVLTPIVERMTDWIDANRQWISTKIGDSVKDVAAALHSVDWKGLAGDIRAIGTAGSWVADRVSDFAKVVGINLPPAAAVLGGVAAIKLYPLIRDFAGLGKEVMATTAKFLAFPAAEFIASLGTLVPAIRGLRDVWVALDLAMRANPLGAAVTAATLLAGAAYEVYEHWDAIRDFFRRLWSDIGDIFDSGWNRLKPIIDSITGAAGWVMDHLPFGSGGGAGSAPGAGAPAGPLSADRSALARRLMDEAASRGLDQAHAIAMLANASAESGLNPLAVNPASGAGGMFQWTGDRLTRARAALGDRWKDPLAQLDYAINEQKSRDRSWFNSTGDLTNSFNRQFEVSGAGDRNAFAAQLGSALAKPIGRPSALPVAKGQVDVNVRIDNKNPPPGTTTSFSQPDPLDLDFGTGLAFGGL